MDHNTTRATILLIAEKYKIGETAALDAFYRSATGAAFSDDDSGLYGQSPNYVFGLYMQEIKEHNCQQVMIGGD